MHEKFPVAIAPLNGRIHPGLDLQPFIGQTLANTLFDFSKQRHLTHNAPLANLPWLQLKLGLDQYQQMAMGLEQPHHCRQYQGHRDKGNIAGDEIKLGRSIHLSKLSLAATCCDHGSALTRLSPDSTLGLEGFNVCIPGIIAVIVIFIDQATIAHPAIRSSRLGFVIFWVIFPTLAEHFFTGIVQRIGGHGTGIEPLHTDDTGICA